MPFSGDAKRVLEFAELEADQFHHRHIGTGHLLLGILRIDGSFAAGVLNNCGITIQDVRKRAGDSTEFIDAEPVAPIGPTPMPIHGHQFDLLRSLERIRLLAEMLSHVPMQAGDGALLLDELHVHVDELKRYVSKVD
jgi:ATP-dependent Clp protease ATP-binding subunit ClpA